MLLSLGAERFLGGKLSTVAKKGRLAGLGKVQAMLQSLVSPPLLSLLDFEPQPLVLSFVPHHLLSLEDTNRPPSSSWPTS